MNHQSIGLVGSIVRDSSIHEQISFHSHLPFLERAAYCITYPMGKHTSFIIKNASQRLRLLSMDYDPEAYPPLSSSVCHRLTPLLFWSSSSLSFLLYSIIAQDAYYYSSSRVLPISQYRQTLIIEWAVLLSLQRFSFNGVWMVCNFVDHHVYPTLWE